MPLPISLSTSIVALNLWANEPPCPNDIIPATLVCEDFYVDIDARVGEVPRAEPSFLHGAGAATGAALEWSPPGHYGSSASITVGSAAGGQDTFFIVQSAWLLDLYGPKLRLSAGPTWAVVAVRGLGIARWYDRYDGDQTPNALKPFAGHARAAGVTATASYAIGTSRIGATRLVIGGTAASSGSRLYNEVHAGVGLTQAARRDNDAELHPR